MTTTAASTRTASTLTIPAVDLASVVRDAKTLRITIGGTPGARQTNDTTANLTIPLDDNADGPWRTLLAGQPAPHPAALEQLAGFIEHTALLDSPPDIIELSGPPAACTLVAAWLRTIWIEETTTGINWIGENDHIEIAENPAHHTAQKANQPTDRISAGLAQWWNIAAARISSKNKAVSGPTPGPASVYAASTSLAESLAITDAMLGLLEHADLAIMGRAKLVQDREDWRRRMRAALERCAASGHKRIALYGAGTHTRAMGDVLCSPGVEIVGIIDDDATRHGEQLWGFTISSMQWALQLAQASPTQLDAVILSANAFEPVLWDRSVSLRRSGVEVIRLYA